MTVDEWLRTNDVTEAEFAERIGSSQAAVNRYRKGRIPEPRVMRRILTATAGAVTPNDFYGLQKSEAA